ncbi:MAG: hypothetical protein D6754_06870 [Alphaproteobacteria bacterium]|nr:MAG: hypothetical protein D6754_06870 [Alphaproteobacteria bacterium]
MKGNEAMTEADREVPDQLLDELFAEARAARPAPDAALLRAIYEDAATVNARRQARAAHRGLRPRMIGLIEWIGGVGALAALAGCIAIGFWIGFSQPVSLPVLDRQEEDLAEYVLFEPLGGEEDLTASLLQEG